MKVGCLHCNQSPCPCPLTHKLVPYPQNKHNNNKVPPSSSNRGLLWWILVADMGSTSNNFNLLREIFPINIWWAEERGTQGHREHCYVDIIGYWIRDVVSVGWNTFLSQPARLSYPLGQRGRTQLKRTTLNFGLRAEISIFLRFWKFGAIPGNRKLKRNCPKAKLHYLCFRFLQTLIIRVITVAFSLFSSTLF